MYIEGKDVRIAPPIFPNGKPNELQLERLTASNKRLSKEVSTALRTRLNAPQLGVVY
tara:strand:+ start:444 stop:614 length:171 start_codon:yes stop_codon:yes gene_type:complete